MLERDAARLSRTFAHVVSLGVSCLASHTGRLTLPAAAACSVGRSFA